MQIETPCATSYFVGSSNGRRFRDIRSRNVRELDLDLNNILPDEMSSKAGIELPITYDLTAIVIFATSVSVSEIFAVEVCMHDLDIGFRIDQGQR